MLSMFTLLRLLGGNKKHFANVRADIIDLIIDQIMNVNHSRLSLSTKAAELN